MEKSFKKNWNDLRVFLSSWVLIFDLFGQYSGWAIPRVLSFVANRRNSLLLWTECKGAYLISYSDMFLHLFASERKSRHQFQLFFACLHFFANINNGEVVSVSTYAFTQTWSCRAYGFSLLTIEVTSVEFEKCTYVTRDNPFLQIGQSYLITSHLLVRKRLLWPTIRTDSRSFPWKSELWSFLWLFSDIWMFRLLFQSRTKTKL